MRLLLLFALCIGYSAISQQQVFDKAGFEHQDKTLPYRILKPIDFDESKTYPLHIFLHGSGERGDDNQAQLKHGSELFIKQNPTYPAIVIFPQCPADDYWAQRTYSRNEKIGANVFKFPKESEPTWAMSAVMALIDQYLEEAYIDKNRVYVSGLSMGGMGTFELLSRRPSLFAAATPICGGGNSDNVAKWAQQTPVWIFHGEDDNVVPSNYSKVMYNSLLKMKATPKLTLYKNVGHNSWDNAFAEKKLFAWIYSKKRKIR
ncbi:phospholipase [Dokdonia pacifica]|uniref:Phospholipase/Carboxylesterase n=1 Tax=Dokdonia pacifica TaxID=1627892 RepID=A0A238ZEP2_9FLAO|nr:prolyl oligopeptidase family serine peptidase [Dokdonia pacifica]GGG05980.1 phospholipase [Dokdonia pacifica]SNR81750.1 Phospholipase/Carboxylesterase [Dokdonia pacifica]